VKFVIVGEVTGFKKTDTSIPESASLAGFRKWIPALRWSDSAATIVWLECTVTRKTPSGTLTGVGNSDITLPTVDPTGHEREAKAKIKKKAINAIARTAIKLPSWDFLDSRI
jgi:hypothetical protein